MTKNKLDLLLQKANTYEKMALFGSRKNYLSALAQQAPKLNSVVQQQIEGVANGLAYSNKPNARDLANKLFDHLRNPNPDLNQLAGDLHQAVNTVPGNNPDVVQNAVDAATAVSQLAQQGQAQPEDGEQVMQMPADKITAIPPFPTNTQNALSSILVNTDQGIPLMPSGKLDKETKTALSKYKQLVPAAAKLQGKALFDKIQDSFMYVHLKQKAGWSSGQILQGLKAGGTGAQARQEQDTAEEQQGARSGVRPFPTQ